MAEIKKSYNSVGEQIYLQTHEKAVVDNNGTTAETKFQMITDLVNQKQMEIGAVPSDLTPTAGSTNWVTSGGLWNKTFEMEKAIGNMQIDNEEVQLTWEQGVISGETGSDLSATVTLRSGFVKYDAIELTCNTGYFIKGVYAYDSESVSSFYGMIYYGNDGTSWDITKNKIYIETDKYLRFTVAKTSNTTIQATEGVNFSASGFVVDTGLDDTVINEVISLKNDMAIANENIPKIADWNKTKKILGLKLTSCGATINTSTNKWAEVNDYYGALVDVENIRGCEVTIKSNSERSTSYTFLKSGVSVGNTPDYATGYTGTVGVGGASTSVTVNVPTDAKYWYVYLHSPNTNYAPEYIILPQTISEYVSARDYGLSVMTYNIGHFSNGVRTYSTITASNYLDKLNKFRALLSTDNPLIYGLQEYSTVFGKNTSNVDVEAKDVLFDYCDKQFVSTQLNYACYAVYAHNVRIYNIEIHDYECLENETITDSRPVSAQDYRYVSADVYYDGVKIKYICTHLAFDQNRPIHNPLDGTSLQEKQIEELIELCENESHVIIVADFNTSLRAPFLDAGYNCAIYNSHKTTANSSLDDVVVKGLRISNAKVVVSDLSDHYPVVCQIHVD